MTMEENQLSDNQLEEVVGGINPRILAPHEYQRYRVLWELAHEAMADPKVSALEFNNAVDNLKSFCLEMKAKYGDKFDYNPQ